MTRVATAQGNVRYCNVSVWTNMCSCFYTSINRVVIALSTAFGQCSSVLGSLALLLVLVCGASAKCQALVLRSVADVELAAGHLNSWNPLDLFTKIHISRARDAW